MKRLHDYKEGQQVKLIGEKGVTVMKGIVVEVDWSLTGLFDKIKIKWDDEEKVHTHYSDDFKFIKPI